MPRPGQSAPPPFVQLALTPNERAQIEGQLSAVFGLTAAAAHRWVETTRRRGACFARVEAGGVIAASYAAEPLLLVHGRERLTAVMLQSCYVHPDFRGRGFGLERSDVEGLRRRFTADVAVLTLFEDGLVPYWRRRGFEVVQRAEVVDSGEVLRRAAGMFSPALDQGAVSAKRAEVETDGATVADIGGLLLVRYPGDDVADELIVTDRMAAEEVANGRRPDLPDVPVRLKTVMANPPGLALVCTIDL